jgi:hypothetical protein
MSPLIAVYIALLVLLIAGVAIGYLRYRSRRRSLTEGQSHVAEPLNQTRRPSGM